MTPFTKEILDGIGRNEEVAFLAAEAVAMAFTYGTESNVGIADEHLSLLNEYPPTAEDIAAITAALVGYLTSSPHEKHASSAVFALGKINDPNLVPLLREQLKQVAAELVTKNAMLGNLICALSNLGEAVMSEQRFSSAELEKNLKDARLYLMRGDGKS
jgi:hypothetical protein